MDKRPLLLLLGITGDMAFAAGCLLLALRRHSPHLGADVLIYTDGELPPGDEALLRGLGARTVPYQPPPVMLRPDASARFPPLALARFEGFRLLARYRTVVWLDVDTAIQDDIADLAAYGPLAMALEDPQFAENGRTPPAGVNFSAPVPGFDPWAPNFNSGVLVLQDTLPDPEGIHSQCLEWLREYGRILHYPDQGVLNLLAQGLLKQYPATLRQIPYDRFNAHPRNPEAQHAAIVHAFGAYKLWDDGLTLCSFPEGSRDYRRWLSLGGSPWNGKMENASYLEGGAFFMLRRLFENCSAAQSLLETQQAALETQRTVLKREEELRKALQSLLETQQTALETQRAALETQQAVLKREKDLRDVLERSREPGARP
jgi:lipopolysaccharide biosynthesis glycosyltransferase